MWYVENTKVFEFSPFLHKLDERMTKNADEMGEHKNNQHRQLSQDILPWKEQNNEIWAEKVYGVK